MEIFLVCFEVDLGYNVESAHLSEVDAKSETDRLNTLHPPRKWIGGDGNEYTGSTKYFMLPIQAK